MNRETAKFLGRAIGTAGVWIGVGMVGLGPEAGAAAVVSIMAAIATAAIWVPTTAD